MYARKLVTAALLALGLAGTAQAVLLQTYGLDTQTWQDLRDKAYLDRGPAGLVEYDREAARRFYGPNAYRSVAELDRQIAIDRAETPLDTQLRADQERYGFGRSAASRDARPPMVTRPLQVGDALPQEYRGRQSVVDDWRGHGLPAPRYGERWVQSGAEYALVGRDGRIKAITRGR